MRSRRSSSEGVASQGVPSPRAYTLEVFLLGGPITPSFARANPVVSRTIEIRGDQTLEQLHRAIFQAFDRWEEHFYEFQLGAGPQDPRGPRYVLPAAREDAFEGGAPVAGVVTETTLAALRLEVGRAFGYWFDYGDDWWHQIDVVAVGEAVPGARYPRVVAREGASPPQYPDEEGAEAGPPPAKAAPTQRATPGRRGHAGAGARSGAAKRSPKEPKARHRFVLNPYPDVRCTRCPMCEAPTRLRKFALAIFLAPEGRVILGLTCRYCPRDDLVIAHQDVLETELGHALATRAPELAGRPYTVIGTVDRAVWRRGLGPGGVDGDDVLAATHPFAHYMELKVDPGGWRPAGGG